MNLVLYFFHAGPHSEGSSGKPPGRRHLLIDHRDHQERFSFIHSFIFITILSTSPPLSLFLIFSLPVPSPPFQSFVVSVSYVFYF